MEFVGNITLTLEDLVALIEEWNTNHSNRIPVPSLKSKMSLIVVQSPPSPAPPLHTEQKLLISCSSS